MQVLEKKEAPALVLQNFGSKGGMATSSLHPPIILRKLKKNQKIWH